MKKLPFLLACLMLLSLVACGKTPDPVSSDPASTPDTTVSSVDIAPSVKIETADSAFEKGTKVTAEKVTTGAVYQRAETAVKEVAKQFTVYELTAVKDNAQVQPDGKVKVLFDIPEGYSDNVTVYYVAQDGKSEALNTTVDAENRTAAVELEHFSTYVLADRGEETTATTTTTTKPTTTTTKATTTTKPTTTTTKKTTTTTKAVTFSAFDSHNWIARQIVGDGQFCHTYEIALVGDDKSMGESTASPYEEMVPPEYRDQEKPSFSFDGVDWYCGSGGGGAIKSVKVEGNTITIIGEDDHAVVLTRIDENTAKVESCHSDLITPEVGVVFSIVK